MPASSKSTKRRGPRQGPMVLIFCLLGMALFIFSSDVRILSASYFYQQQPEQAALLYLDDESTQAVDVTTASTVSPTKIINREFVNTSSSSNNNNATTANTTSKRSKTISINRVPLVLEEEQIQSSFSVNNDDHLPPPPQAQLPPPPYGTSIRKNDSDFLEFWNASHYWSANITRLNTDQTLSNLPRLPQPSRMLVGILTMTKSKERRQLIRETALNFHKDMQGYTKNNANDTSKYYKVCSLWEIQTQAMRFEDCLLTYVFVAAGGDDGAPTLLLEHNSSSNIMTVSSANDYQDEKDLILLNIRENMNEGKTLTWFKYASTLAREQKLHFDYIAKMDDDTLLFTGNWIDALERNLARPHQINPNGLVYGGKINQLLRVWHEECTDFLQCPVIGPLWMIGPFYFLSTTLADYITSNFLDHEALASFEDVATASLVFSHPETVSIMEIKVSNVLLTYDFAWDWQQHIDNTRFKGTIFAHSEDACFMPMGPYYKRAANVRKVWREYIIYRWKKRTVFYDRYRLDDHPTASSSLDDGKKDTRGVTVHHLDYIYSNDDFDASPIVLESPYNLVFFPVSGAGDVVWRCWIRRLLGFQDWDDPTLQFDGLRYLSNYSLTQASDIMSSQNYTRAMYIRNPLERLQSNYIQMVEHDQYHTMLSGCDCARDCYGDLTAAQTCLNSTRTFRLFLRDLVPTCDKPYWRPQSYRMEPKYLQRLDFIGHYESFTHDAVRLLQSLVPKEALPTWINEQELRMSFDQFDNSYSTKDHATRFKGSWRSPFQKVYKNELHSTLFADYTIRLPAFAQTKGKQKP